MRGYAWSRHAEEGTPPPKVVPEEMFLPIRGESSSRPRVGVDASEEKESEAQKHLDEMDDVFNSICGYS